MTDPISADDSLGPHDAEAFARFLSDLQRHLAVIHEELERDPDRPIPPPPLPRRQPLRVSLLDSLADMGYPSASNMLRSYIEARYDRDVPSSQFGTVAAQERKAFDRRGSTARSVWLCNGVRHDDFRPVKRIWARSDWPLDWRVITPLSERVQRLYFTDALCEILLREEAGPNASALRGLALVYAEDLPGVEIDFFDPDFDACGTIARQLLAEYEPEDRRRREDAAARLERLPERVQLFGMERTADA